MTIATAESLAEYKTYFGIEGAFLDNIIQLALESAFTIAERMTGFVLNRKVADATLKGITKTNNLIIPEYVPFVKITSVTVNGNEIPASTDYLTKGYYIENHCLKFRGYSVPEGSYYEVVCNYGWENFPADLKLAIYRLAAFEIAMSKHIGMKQQSGISQETTTYQETIPPDILDVFQYYRNLRQW